MGSARPHFVQDLLTPTHRDRFKDALHKLKEYAETYPNEAWLNDIFCEVVTEKSSSKNAELLLYVWKSYIQTLSPKTLVNSSFFLAIGNNISQSPAKVSQLAQALLISASKKAWVEAKFYDGLLHLVQNQKIPFARTFSSVYRELLLNPESQKETLKRIHLLLNEKTPNHIKLALLRSLHSAKVKPFKATIQTAVTLIDYKNQDSIFAIEYLMFVAQNHPDALAPFESEVLTRLSSVFFKFNQSSITDKAVYLLKLIPKWNTDPHVIGAMLNRWTQDDAPTLAKAAAFNVLSFWIDHDRDFFSAVTDDRIWSRVKSLASRKGHSTSHKSCRSLMAAVKF